MQEVSGERDVLVSRISAIVDNLIQGNNLFQEKLDKDEIIELLVSLFDKFSPEELRAIPNDDLTDRIDSILVIEAVAGTLNDLTPKQMQIFDAAVKGRSFIIRQYRNSR